MSIPSWLPDLIGVEIPEDGCEAVAHGVKFVRDGDVLRAEETASSDQQQTGDVFGFKWNKRDTFDGTLARVMRRWLVERYGDVTNAPWMREHGTAPVLLDVGCGAGVSVLELWDTALPAMRYLGVDISRSVDIARDRFQERGLTGAFIQASLHNIPLPKNSVDLIFSEGALHHCDDTRAALEAIVSHLKPDGRILFYVYRKKGPVREFTDDYIRERLQNMSPEEMWDAIMPLTRLGKLLGELDLEIDVPDDVALLEIPSGRINIQRLFYWHIFKAYYRAELSLDEMNHVNFDWYAPKNAHRQTPDDVRSWCALLDLVIERERVEAAGITIIARKSP